MLNITYTLIWWIWLIFLGVIAIPLTVSIFGKFFDKGYGLSKIIIILLTSYVTFLLSTIKLLPFHLFSLIFVITIFLGINTWIYSTRRKIIISAFSKTWRLFVFEEIVFALGLFLWTFVRAHQPDINGLEKLMDYGFVNSILTSKFFPPSDMWASGYPINYYWYGHFVTAFLTKLTSIPSGFTYNLMLGTILGLSLTASFSLISSLLWYKFKGKFKKAVVAGGLISTILLNFAGNFHTPYFVLKNGVDKYWYPDATRFIGYNPDIDDKTIHEFPIYSYVVSDLHAHLLNLPFVLLYLSLLYSFATSRQSKNKISKLEALNTKQIINSKYQNPKLFNSFVFKIMNLFRVSDLGFRISQYKPLIFLGFVLGVMFMTNAWDFANYLLVTGFVLLLSPSKKIGKLVSVDYIFRLALRIIAIIIIAGITVLPFIINFESIAEGLKLTHTKTPLWQLAILWGFPALKSTLFILSLIFSKKPKKTDVFILALLISSWTLIVIPEFIYVKDIYAATHYRANTMFKLTYQAYVMFYLSSGYITVTLLKKSRSIVAKLGMALIFSTAFAAILYYPFLAVKSYYGKIFDKENPVKSLAGNGWIADKYPDTLQAINWLKTNVSGQPVILEAPGDSYTDYNVISSYTGLPTISGWYVHEWLWRGTPDFPQARVDDITQIYNIDSPELAKQLLDKYSVNYVVVGSFEREKFPELVEDKFDQIGQIVFTSPTAKIYQINKK